VDPKFEALAVYNAECARGVVHTAEYDQRMAALQAEFDGRPASDEDRIREAMAAAQEHPGRIITR
jgi:hypothetical protein